MGYSVAPFHGEHTESFAGESLINGFCMPNHVIPNRIPESSYTRCWLF